jgi:hypothetical protein
MVNRMSERRKLYGFSVTIRSENIVLIYALRGISDYCQKTVNSRIAWGGTGKREWERDGHQVTFHFTEASYRDNFLHQARIFFPKGDWQERDQKDNDPPANS